MELQTKWVLCHNGIDIFHYVFFTEGQSVESGQPYMEFFDTKEQLISRVAEINPQYNLEIE